MHFASMYAPVFGTYDTVKGVSSLRMHEFLESRIREGNPFQADANSVLLFIDLSGSTRESDVRQAYDRIVSDIIDKESNRPGVHFSRIHDTARDVLGHLPVHTC